MQLRGGDCDSHMLFCSDDAPRAGSGAPVGGQGGTRVGVRVMSAGRGKAADRVRVQTGCRQGRAESKGCAEGIWAG